jgi:phosphoglycerate dehydrogenase-like enzyme
MYSKSPQEVDQSQTNP